MREAVCGYPLHAWLAVGHLSQAEAELMDEHEDLCHVVRAERLNYIEGLKFNIDDQGIALMTEYHIDTLDLLDKITRVHIEDEAKANVFNEQKGELLMDK